jgi:hypothetical protein
MAYRSRIFFTDKQKSEIWDRWQRGESMSSIGREFDRESSSIYPLLSRTGGIRAPQRRRSRLALSLAEREEISRGLESRLTAFGSQPEAISKRKSSEFFNTIHTVADIRKNRMDKS